MDLEMGHHRETGHRGNDQLFEGICISLPGGSRHIHFHLQRGQESRRAPRCGRTAGQRRFKQEVKMKRIADFSDYQEGIDFNLLNMSYDGVIVKISEGCSLMDCYEGFLEQAKEKDMEWGVYALTRAFTEERAKEEADVVCDELDRIGIPALKIWFDIEPDHADAVGSPEELTAIASAFISECNRREYECGVYGNYDTLTNHFQPYSLAKYVEYWSSEPGNWKCDFKEENPDLKVRMWQKRFDVPTARREVDINEWYEDEDE